MCVCLDACGGVGISKCSSFLDGWLMRITPSFNVERDPPGPCSVQSLCSLICSKLLLEGDFHKFHKPRGSILPKHFHDLLPCAMRHPPRHHVHPGSREAIASYVSNEVGVAGEGQEEPAHGTRCQERGVRRCAAEKLVLSRFLFERAMGSTTVLLGFDLPPYQLTILSVLLLPNIF